MSDEDFRWRAFFQRSTDPLFVLNRRCYLLFVNSAWERLTGIGVAEARRMYCHRPRPARPNQSWRAVLSHAMTPPPEVLDGLPLRARRLIPGREGQLPRWWDVDFFPLLDEQGFRGAVGRITPVPSPVSSPAPPLPEGVVALRQRQVGRLDQVFLEGKQPAVRRLAEQVRLAAGMLAPVTLVGGPGTGKRTLARLIHFRGPDREQSFAALDCERLPPFAVGALLLGESGAPARAPLATVYLREPGTLPRDLQTRLCALLERETNTPGARSPRFLAGFSEDPHEQVRRGRLLEEFGQALGTFRIDVPSLAERRDDLPHLVDRLLQRLNADGDRVVQALTPDAWEVVLAYGWPGNLRELHGVLRSARVHAASDTVDAVDLPAPVRQAVRLGELPGPRPERTFPYDRLVEQVERHLLQTALRQARGNRSKAAEILAISRPRLLRRMQELGITDERPPE
jgi:transcriptional regulator with AAA-type ATPase domain